MQWSFFTCFLICILILTQNIYPCRHFAFSIQGKEQGSHLKNHGETHSFWWLLVHSSETNINVNITKALTCQLSLDRTKCEKI